MTKLQRKKNRQESLLSLKRRDEMRRRGYVTALEASVLARTPRQTIYTWVRDKRLGYKRVGAGRIYVAVADLVSLCSASMGETP